MKKLLGILVLSLLLSGNAHAKKNDIVIPKYFKGRGVLLPGAPNPVT